MSVWFWKAFRVWAEGAFLQNINMNCPGPVLLTFNPVGWFKSSTRSLWMLEWPTTHMYLSTRLPNISKGLIFPSASQISCYRFWSRIESGVWWRDFPRATDVEIVISSGEECNLLASGNRLHNWPWSINPIWLYPTPASPLAAIALQQSLTRTLIKPGEV